MTTDVNGRKYATVLETKAGSVVQVDEGFTCIETGAQRTVKAGKEGLYIDCRCGEHYLDGQLDFDGGAFYVGLYPVEALVAA